MRFFFRTHGECRAFSIVPETRLLDDRLAVLDRCDLAFDLVLDRLLHHLERVQVLDLDLGPEFFLAGRSYRHVRITTQTSLFHIAIANFHILKDRLKRGQIIVSFLGTPDIRFGYDLEKRHSAAVIVHQTAVNNPFME